jgi:biotin synthase
MIDIIKNKVINGEVINSDEAILLSQTENKETLYNAANEIREHFCSNEFELCSITNAKSGKCSEDCKWCSQSIHHNTAIDEYEIIDRTQAIKEGLDNAKQGVKRHSLVTSGRKISNKTLDELIPIFQEITEKSGIKLCASMGLITEEQMIRLKNEAGIDHYHCNIETAPSNFSNLVTTHTLDEKIETVKLAQKHGIQVCSGGIIGMGETMEQRIEMALLLRELGVKSIPINILQAVKGTALENSEPLKEEEILTTLAIFRFINPDSRLCLAGGRVQIKHFQDKALKAGVSAAITGDYLTSTGSNTQEDIRDFEQAGFRIAGTM